MLIQVPTVRTDFTVSQFITSLIKAWGNIYASFPTKAQIGVIYSQWGVETGLGTYCWNNNIGNIKAVDAPGQTVPYCALNGVWEVVNGQRVAIPPTNPGAWFRAFPDLDTGVAWYFGLLRGARYKNAWVAVEQGDVGLFAHLLKQQGYYTAPEADYARIMNYYFNKFMNDTLYDSIIQQMTSQNQNISFPGGYSSVDLNISDQTLTSSGFVNVSDSGLQNWVNKAKQFFGIKL